MKTILNVIRNILIVIIVLGFLMAGVDYVRMTSGTTPIFNISSYNSRSKIQTYRGLFYVAKRKVKASINEPLVDSTGMTFKILVFDVKVPRKFEKEDSFKIETKPTDNCQNTSKLYYADLKIKVYTYCLDSIKVKDDTGIKELSEYIKKKSTILDDIDTKLDLTGVYKDKTTLMFKEKDDDFTNNGLTMYRCNKNDINDIYFAPKDTDFKNDFCTYKDDDLKFIFEIDDQSENVEGEKETFYSDNEYDYQFEYPKSDKVYIIVPAVRRHSEKKFLVKEVLEKKLLTIEDLEKKGLKFDKVAKK